LRDLYAKNNISEVSKKAGLCCSGWS